MCLIFHNSEHAHAQVNTQNTSSMQTNSIEHTLTDLPTLNNSSHLSTSHHPCLAVGGLKSHGRSSFPTFLLTCRDQSSETNSHSGIMFYHLFISFLSPGQLLIRQGDVLLVRNFIKSIIEGEERKFKEVCVAIYCCVLCCIKWEWFPVPRPVCCKHWCFPSENTGSRVCLCRLWSLIDMMA